MPPPFWPFNFQLAKSPAHDTWYAPITVDIDVTAANDRETVGVMHHRRAWLQRDVLPAGVDQIEVLVALGRDRSIPDHAVFGMIDDVGVADIGVRAHRRNADAQIDHPTVLELARDEVGHLLAVQSLGPAHLRRSWRFEGHNPSGAGGT